MAHFSECESVWFEQSKYESAEGKYQGILADRHSGLKVEGKAIVHTAPTSTDTEKVTNPISTEIEKAMDLIGKSLKSSSVSVSAADLEKRVTELEKENKQLKTTITDILTRLNALEGNKKEVHSKEVAKDADVDDDFDLFGSDEEEAETNAVHQERIARYAEKKSKKAPVVAKSSLILDVKPWDDETDLSEMERMVRGLATDGLVWGASKILPVAYGINKLQISCVIEDDKVGTDYLEESITSFEDLVQSVDVVAFNKI